jgi:hypothetical protein
VPPSRWQQATESAPHKGKERAGLRGHLRRFHPCSRRRRLPLVQGAGWDRLYAPLTDLGAAATPRVPLRPTVTAGPGSRGGRSPRLPAYRGYLFCGGGGGASFPPSPYYLALAFVMFRSAIRRAKGRRCI